jgi:hypothetical protein
MAVWKCIPFAACPLVLFLSSETLATERSAVAQACITSSEAGTRAQQDNALRAARRHFLDCAAPACPTVIRSDCARRVEEIDAVQPSLVVGAKDARGVDLVDVRVSIDGENVTGHEAGQAWPVEPGPHVIHFERPGKVPREIRVLVRTGDRNRAVIATLEDAATPSGPKSTDTARSFPLGAAIAAGVGVAALASFGYFGATGLGQRARLSDTCGPRCTSDELAPLQTSFIAADVSLAIGIVALGLATYLKFGTN